MGVYFSGCLRHGATAIIPRFPMSSIIFFLGTLPLVIGYIRQGYMTTQLTLLSTYLLIPTLIGFWVGEKIRSKMSEIIFRKSLLCLFSIMGLNLIRRAYFP